MSGSNRTFKRGDKTRTKNKEFLDEFLTDWNFEGNIKNDLLKYHNTVSLIKEISSYHGGDVLYELEGIPGIWHEKLLEDINRDETQDNVSIIHYNYDEEKLIVSILRKNGFNINGLYDLVNNKRSYKKAIPILIEFLPKVQDDVIKERIVRLLMTKDAEGIATLPLINEFNKTDTSKSVLKNDIAYAIYLTAKPKYFNDIIELIKDKRHGEARIKLVFTSHKMPKGKATKLLFELLDDDELTKVAIQFLGEFKSKKVIKKIRQLCDHPDPEVNRWANIIMKRLDKSWNK